MPRLLNTALYEKIMAQKAAKAEEGLGILPPGAVCASIQTPAGRAESLREMMQATAGSNEPHVQLRHELLKNLTGSSGAKGLREIAAAFGQTLAEFAEDKLIFDLEMEALFGDSMIWDVSGTNMLSAGPGLDNYGNAGGYPSTTGRPSGGNRSNGPRG